MANPGNAVFGGGIFEERVGAGAVGALEVFKLDDGDARAGRRLEGRPASWTWVGIGRAELSAGRGRGEGGNGEGKRKADEFPARGEDGG